MKRIGEFLLAKNIHAAIIALLFTLLPLLNIVGGGFVAAAIIAFITLQKGYKDGLFVLAFVAIPAVGMLFLREMNVFDVLLVGSVLAWWFAGLLRQHGSWRLVFEIGVLIAFIAIVILHVAFDMHAFWFNFYHVAVKRLAAYKVNPAQWDTQIKLLVPYATGMMGLIVFLVIMLELLFARWWQSLMFNPGGLGKEFARIRMSKAMATIFIAVLIGKLFGQKILIDFFPILFLPFVMSGLAVLHAVKGRMQILGHGMAAAIGLFIIYVGLFSFIFTQIVVMLLAAIGYIDSWYDIRERFQLLKINYQK